MHRHPSSRLAGRKPAQRQARDALAAVGPDQTVLLPWAPRGPHTSTPLASAVYLRPSRTASYLSAGEAQDNRLNHRMLLAVFGMALAYIAIAIANTPVMATASRTRELATLRLSGATPAQVLTMIGTEACLVAGIGAVLAAGVTAAASQPQAWPPGHNGHRQERITAGR